MTLSEIQKQYWDTLSPIYGEREARSVTKLVLEHILEMQPHLLALERFRIITIDQHDRLNKILRRLKTSEPVQYVLEEADFCGLKFKVNSNVLIPRPETEELIYWIEEFRIPHSAFRILDVGTGSGCIPISLAKLFPTAQIQACDISEAALKVAEENNRLNKTQVSFFQHDILTGVLAEGKYDIIVSNPPYISPAEKNLLADNVLQYEPHLALFATGEDDLIFYRRITAEATRALKPGGQLFFEINASRGPQVVAILKQAGFANVELRKDLSGKDRMVRGVK